MENLSSDLVLLLLTWLRPLDFMVWPQHPTFSLPLALDTMKRKLSFLNNSARRQQIGEISNIGHSHWIH